MGRDWAHLFPVLLHPCEANRRIRWPWGAFEHFRAAQAACLAEDLLEAGLPPRLLCDESFKGTAFAAGAGRPRHRRARPAHQEWRKTMPAALQEITAK